MVRRIPLHKRPMLYFGVIALVAGAVWAYVQAQGPRVPAVAVRRGNIEQHLVASGRVLAPARIDVAALVTGRVVSVGAREGDRVKTGDVLVQLDDAEAKAQLALADAASAEASTRVQQVNTVAAVVASRMLTQTEAHLANAEQQFERTRSLVASGAIPQQQLDDAMRGLDVARAQRDAAQAQQVGSIGVDARAAWAALSQAEAQVTAAKVRLTQTRIVAVADAVVLTRDVEPGDAVQPARTLMELATAGETRIVLQPDERDLAYVKVGQQARASADAFPEDVFDAEVSWIAPSIDVQRGTVEVRLTVPRPPAHLRPDMTVSVDLAVATRKGALAVPSESVRGLATPRPWVLAASNGRAERRDLKLGIRGEGSVEVLRGVEEGELVVLPHGQPVQPGQRVRAYREEP